MRGRTENWSEQVRDTARICVEDDNPPTVEWAASWWEDWADLFYGPRPPSYILLRAELRAALDELGVPR